MTAMSTLMPIFCLNLNFILKFHFPLLYFQFLFFYSITLFYITFVAVLTTAMETLMLIFCSDFNSIFNFIFHYFISTSIFLSNEFILYYFILDRWQKFGTDTDSCQYFVLALISFFYFQFHFPLLLFLLFIFS